MPSLKKTSYDMKHDHVIYLREDTRVGAMSTDREHTHEVIWAEAVGDVPGEWVIVESASPKVKPHNHSLIDLPVEVKKKSVKDDSSKKIARVKQLYRTAMDIEKDAREKGLESEKFYEGGKGQWDDAIMDDLEDKERAALTLNYCESMIDFLSGVHRQHRTDWRWRPTEEGDSKVADILDVVTKNVAARSHMPMVENDVFESGAIVGRGFFEVTVDYSEHIKGRIKIGSFPWDAAFLGPHDSIIGEDLEYLTKKTWYSIANIKSMFPEHADEIEKMFADMMELAPSSKLREGRDNYGATVSESKDGVMDISPDLVDIAKKRIALLENWEKEYHKTYILLDADYGEEGYTENMKDYANKDVRRFKTIDGLRMIEKIMTKFKITKVAGDVILEEEYSKLPFNNFDLIPFYAKKKGASFWGKIEPGKDAQRQINKTASKFTDIFNRVDNFGYWYDENTFDSPVDRNKALNGITQPGFFLRCADAQKHPVREEGIRFPTEVANLWNMMIQNFRFITNIDPLAMGQTQGSRESGASIEMKTRQTLTGNEFLFDNFSISKAIVGRHVVALIRDVYTPERVMRIISNQAQKEQIMIGGKLLEGSRMDEMPQMVTPQMQQQGQDPAQQQEQITLSEVQALFENADLLEYDVEASEGAYGPTTRAANQAYFLELAKTPVGAALPPQLYISMLDMPEKDKILAAVNQWMQQQQMVEQGKQQTEIQKTQIAQQGKMQG